jgi:PAS domain S-box-containing protein
MPLRSIYKPEPRLKRELRRVLPYGTAALTSSAALGLSLLIPQIAQKPFFIFFFAATAACAWLHGIPSGVVSIVFNAFALDYFVLPPTGSLLIENSDDLIRLLVFIVVSGALSWTLARFRSTQQALELAQERFELAHEIANIWSWELDLPTGKVIWSSNPKRRTGQHEDSVQAWLEMVHPEDRDRVLAALKRAIETTKPYEIEFRVLMSSGTVRWIASSGEFYRTGKGVQRMIGVNIDITLRKKAEQALEAAAKGEMAGELAHQINNPLQGLIHALYLLRQQVAESEANQFSLVAQSEAERVSQLVKELLRLYASPRQSV